MGELEPILECLCGPMKSIRIAMGPKNTLFTCTYLSFPPIVPCFFLILLSLVNSPLEIDNLQHGWEDTHNACFLYLSCAILFHVMMRNVELLQITLHWDYGIVPGGNDDGKNEFETFTNNCTRVEFEHFYIFVQIWYKINTLTPCK